MDKTVFTLCMLTSALCAVLLFQGYARSGMRLLLWSAICFSFLAVSNVLVYVDLVIFAGPDIDLSVLRSIITCSGLGVLIYGMIRETV